jgi:hypothetical protein
MSYVVKLKRSAEKELDRLPVKAHNRILLPVGVPHQRENLSPLVPLSLNKERGRAKIRRIEDS